jgi:hypothetical protein
VALDPHEAPPGPTHCGTCVFDSTRCRDKRDKRWVRIMSQWILGSKSRQKIQAVRQIASTRYIQTKEQVDIYGRLLT